MTNNFDRSPQQLCPPRPECRANPFRAAGSRTHSRLANAAPDSPLPGSENVGVRESVPLGSGVEWVLPA